MSESRMEIQSARSKHSKKFRLQKEINLGGVKIIHFLPMNKLVSVCCKIILCPAGVFILTHNSKRLFIHYFCFKSINRTKHIICIPII